MLQVWEAWTFSGGLPLKNRENRGEEYEEYKAKINHGMVTLLLNDHPMQFKMDRGADVTVILNKVLQKLHYVMLYAADRQLHGPNNQRLTVIGCF